MPRRMIRVFAEIDYPENMPDPSTEDGSPFKPTMILRQIVNAGSTANGYAVEEFQQGTEIGFKLVKV